MCRLLAHLFPLILFLHYLPFLFQHLTYLLKTYRVCWCQCGLAYLFSQFSLNRPPLTFLKSSKCVNTPRPFLTFFKSGEFDLFFLVFFTPYLFLKKSCQCTNAMSVCRRIAYLFFLVFHPYLPFLKSSECVGVREYPSYTSNPPYSSF